MDLHLSTSPRNQLSQEKLAENPKSAPNMKLFHFNICCD